MTRFIDENRDRFGVEPICRALGVSASAYYHRKTGVRSARVLEDERLLGVIRQTHKDNYYAYGYRKMWRTLARAGETAPRCRVQRLMADHGIQGAKRRGKRWRTTTPDPVPALLLGRLSVDHRYTNLGVGTALAAHVLATVVELNEKAACRAVVVTALHPNARAWWEQLGFHPFEPDDPDRLDLYLLSSEIGATLKRAR
jgi:hypothetical protein